MLLNIQKYLRERARSHTSNNTCSCKKYKTTLEFRNVLLHTEANTVQIEPAVVVESSYCKCENGLFRITATSHELYSAFLVKTKCVNSLIYFVLKSSSPLVFFVVVVVVVVVVSCCCSFVDLPSGHFLRPSRGGTRFFCHSFLSL